MRGLSDSGPQGVCVVTIRRKFIEKAIEIEPLNLLIELGMKLNPPCAFSNHKRVMWVRGG